MAITTFAELKAAIEDYLVRTNAQLNARTEDFIALFEGRRRKRTFGYICNQEPGWGQSCARRLHSIEASRTVTPTVIGTGIASARANLGEALKSRP